MEHLADNLSLACKILLVWKVKAHGLDARSARSEISAQHPPNLWETGFEDAKNDANEPTTSSSLLPPSASGLRPFYVLYVQLYIRISYF